MGITIHSTRGGSASLETDYRGTVNYFLNSPYASSHIVVGPGEVTVMVKAPDGAWHGQELNYTHLSVEVAQPNTNFEFTEFQYLATAKFCREWCAKYNIPKQRVMSQYHRGIVGHEDTEQGRRNGKSDPGPRWNWQRFIALL